MDAGPEQSSTVFECLYKCGSGVPSTQEYHVYPLSGSALDVRLVKGVVCDKCNAYFSKLEAYFIARPPGASARLLHVRQTRKGKPPKFESRAGTATRRDQPGNHTFTFPLERVQTEFLSNGDIVLRGEFTPLPFDSVKISRVLAKIALEYVYCVNPKDGLDPFSERFDAIRQYARSRSGKLRFLWFAWKRSKESQGLPRVIAVQDSGAPPVAWLCRVSLPGVAYLVPLPPVVEPAAVSRNLDGWQVVNTAGQVRLEAETVDVTLIKAPSTTQDTAATGRGSDLEE